MLDPAITDFLKSKKEDFLKKKTKSSTSYEVKLKLEQEANDKSSLKEWLIDASNRAYQLSFSSHPAKFVHPDAKATSIIAKCTQKNDGLLRYGNVAVDLDIFGNAAALDVEKFLRLKLQDNKSILQHLEHKTDYIKQQFEIKNLSFTDIRNNFLKIKQSNLEQTSNKLKQVYFPVDGDYHLLSILTPSGIIYKLKDRINEIRFSDENKKLKKALISFDSINGKINNISNLTAIGYGGSNPRNISVLNMKNTKKINNVDSAFSFLLYSMPPQFKKRKTQPPKTNFFDNCLWGKLFKDEFDDFNQILVWQKNNKDIRNKRDSIVINSITKVARIIENIRTINNGWSDNDTYRGLDEWQKIWLDNQYQEIRNDDKQNQQYLEKAQSGFANWFINNYKTISDSKTLGSDDIDHIKNILKQDQELLK